MEIHNVEEYRMWENVYEYRLWENVQEFRIWEKNRVLENTDWEKIESVEEYRI